MPPDMKQYEDDARDDAEDAVSMIPKFEEALPEPVFRRRRHSWYEEMMEQSRVAWPSMASMLLYRLPWLISLRFVGGLAVNELAAAALATTLCNVTGLSVAVGLASALTTLTSQSRGRYQGMLMARHNERPADDEARLVVDVAMDMEEDGHDEDDHDLGTNEVCTSMRPENEEMPLAPLVYLYRGLLVQALLVGPMGILWLSGYVAPILVRWGQGAELAVMTQDYLRVLTPGLWTYSANWTVTAWLQTLGLADVPAATAGLVLLPHVLCNWLLIGRWGYLGAAYATVLVQITQPVLAMLYVFGTGHGQQRVLDAMAAGAVQRTRLSVWPEAHVALQWQGIVQYLGLALPGLISISEWWASEIAIFLAGRLQPDPNLALGSMTLYQSINAFCFMFPVGFSIAGAARVGTLLGAGEPNAAAYAAKVCTMCAGMLSVLIATILLVMPQTWIPSLFAPKQDDLIEETAAIIPLLALYVVGDGLQVALNGVLKGCGRQLSTVPIVVLAYWIVGLPLAYFVVFQVHDGLMCNVNGYESYLCGDLGLVLGLTTGTWLHMILLALLVLCFVDWKREARSANHRVGGVANGDNNAIEMAPMLPDD